MVSIRLWLNDYLWLKQYFPDNHNGQIRRIVGEWIIANRKQVERGEDNETQV